MVDPNQDKDEKPLDPEVERVRQKMARFLAINLGLLFAAVMAVLIAVVYKSGIVSFGSKDVAWQAPADGAVTEADIALPEGARVLSQSLDNGLVALTVELAGGRQSIFIYDLTQRRVVARLAVKAGN